MSEQRDLGEMVDRRTRAALAHVHTSLPAKVLKFDAHENTVDVELVTKADFYDAETRERGFDERSQIGNVPVIWPRGGGYVMTLPLAAGDFVWLMFSEQALGEWRQSGQVSEPADARRHSIGHPYALPGAFPDVERLASVDDADRAARMVIGENGGPTQIVIDADAVPGPIIKIGKTATSFVALADLVQTALDLIKNHTHATGASNPSGELAAGLGPVAATMTKAK